MAKEIENININGEVYAVGKIYSKMGLSFERFVELLGRDLYCPTLPQAPTSSTVSYKDTDDTVNTFQAGQPCRWQEGNAWRLAVCTNNIGTSATWYVLPTKVSELNNDAGYLTSHQDISHLATKTQLSKKQDKISDLETIRSNAGKGATALPLSGGTMTGEIKFSIADLIYKDISAGIITAFKAPRVQINELISNYIYLGSASEGSSSDSPLVIRKYSSITDKSPSGTTDLVTINTSGNVTAIGGFTGNLTGTATNATTADSATNAGSAGSLVYNSSLRVNDSVSNGTISYARLDREEVGVLPSSSNANGVLTLNTHRGDYHHQLGFSSNGNIYSRYSAGAELSDNIVWKQIAFTDSDITGNAASATKATQDGNGKVIADTYAVKDEVLGYDDVGGSVEDAVEYLTTSEQNLSDAEKERVKTNIGVNVPIIDHGTNDSTFSLTPNKYHRWGTMSSLSISLAPASDNTVVSNYGFEFTSGATPTSFSYPSDVQFIHEIKIEANKRYQGIISNGMGVLVSVNKL